MRVGGRVFGSGWVVVTITSSESLEICPWVRLLDADAPGRSSRRCLYEFVHGRVSAPIGVRIAC